MQEVSAPSTTTEAPEPIVVITALLLTTLWEGLCSVEPCPYSFRRMQELGKALQGAPVFNSEDDLRKALIVPDLADPSQPTPEE